jgi:aminoglycoside phosphotransferase (APT) family kinase protein
MNDLIDNIDWKEIDDNFEILLENHGVARNIIPLDSGLEADVFKITIMDSEFVLKVWNRKSKPDISIQYKLLKCLHNKEIVVSKPFGWGIDGNHNRVLLTGFNGVPVSKVNKTNLHEIADILIDIHKLDGFENLQLPKYDFEKYFFPGIEKQNDIKDLLNRLVSIANMEQKCVIHGDFNLGNILESEGGYTIIDWTNVQLGDPRYDIAWSTILIWFYLSERNYDIYRSCFLTKYRISEEELEIFEAVACLRWILLNRIANLPKHKDTKLSVKNFLKKNKYLNEGLL